MPVWALEVLPKTLTKPIDFSSLGVVLLVFWPRVLLMSPPCPSTLRHMYLYTRRFPPNAHVHSSIPPICICTYVYVHPSIIHPFLSVRSNFLHFYLWNQISFMFICKCPCTHGGNRRVYAYICLFPPCSCTLLIFTSAFLQVYSTWVRDFTRKSLRVQVF